MTPSNSEQPNPQGSLHAVVGPRGISVSRELIKPREQQIAESFVSPSGFLLAWLETDSRSDVEAQPNHRISGGNSIEK